MVGLGSSTTLVNSGLGSGSVAVREGKLDAVHGFAGVPISGLTELAESVPCRLLKYTPAELKTIVMRSADVMQVKIEEEGAFEIARRSRGTPRLANRLLKRVRDFARSSTTA